MRRASLWAIAVLVLCAVQAIALQAHPHPKLSGREKTPDAKQSTTEGPVVDATGIGSPIVLDKGWRVGVSSNPAMSVT